ncbi:DNA repair exonuclease [Candidatus Azambacteria bacterium]|nr:DNA repair exonuclease [Candidatus Azambacteria bacterium]
MIKIIHTGDIHLGAKFSSFGKKSAEQRRALLNSFKKVVDETILKKAHILLISGDLFDSNFPSYDTVNAVKSELKKLDELGVYVAILPGTHDCLSADSIYKRENFSEGLSHIYIFDDENITSKFYPELDLVLYAKANTSNKSKQSPVEFLQSEEKQKARHKVAMAHGSIEIEGKSADDDWPIKLSEISKSQMQYIALGHWHGAQDFSFGATKAWYCGSPEITYKEGKGGLGQGYAIEVDITSSAEVKPFLVSEKKIEEMNIELDAFSDIDGIYKEIEKKSDPNTILILSISGIVHPNLFLDEEKIESDLSDKFFSIKVKNNSSLKIENITEREYPEDMVVGQFVALMRERINASQNEEDKKVFEEALQLGVAELEGKEVL